VIGRTLSHFKITAKLGEGGMGIVYRAEDESLRRPVALKVLAGRLVENEEHRLRFLREARAAAAVTHPHVSTIYEIGEAEGVVFIAMELVEGKTLRETMGGKALAVKQAVRLACEIAEGLGAAHASHVIHRDLKPDNIIVAKDGHAKVLDFGLAKLLQDAGVDPGEPVSQLDTISGELTKAGKVMGTASYMSPEQARGEKVDARSDLFSFGVTLYEMVTGRPPFRGKTSTDVLSAIIRDAVVPASQANPEVPAELDRIIGACLEKDPGERYQHADQLVVDLRRLRRVMDSGVQTVPGAGATGEVRRRPIATVWNTIGAAVLAGCLIAGGVAAWRSLAPKPGIKQGDMVLVADFENLTGESRFDTAVRDVFEFYLGTNFVQPVKADHLNGLLGIPPDAPRPNVDNDLARQVCGHTPCVGHFTGRIRKMADVYQVEAEYLQGGRSTPLIDRKSPAVAEADLVGVIYQLANDMRRDLKEPPATLSNPYKPAMCSLAASQLVVLAANLEQRSEWDAILLLKKALELDPACVDIHWNLAIRYNNLGQAREARHWATEQYRRTGGLENRQRLLAEYLYFAYTYDYDAAVDALKTYRQVEPSSSTTVFNIGSSYLYNEDDPILAEPPLRRALELAPGNHMCLLGVCNDLAIQGRAAEIADVLETFRDAGGAEEDALLGRMWAEVSVRDWSGIKQTVTRLTGETGTRRVLSLQLSLLADLSAGRMGSARESAAVLSRAAVENHDFYGKQFAAAARIWLEMRLNGSPAELPPKAEAPADEDLWSFRDFATFSVETNLVEPLRSILKGYEAEFKDSQARFVREEIQYGRACLALIEGQPAQARALLEPLAQSSQFLRRHHVLAQVYERLGMWDRAAEEYQAVLKDPPRKWFLGNPAFWALDQYRLAKVSERANRPEKAKEWYERFLTDWKEADPGIPEVDEARKRLAALGGSPPPAS